MVYDEMIRSTYNDSRKFRVPFIGRKGLNGSVEFLHYSDVTSDSSCHIISTQNIFILLVPIIPVVRMCPLRVKKASTKGVNMSVNGSSLWNGKDLLFRGIWLWSMMR